MWYVYYIYISIRTNYSHRLYRYATNFACISLGQTRPLFCFSACDKPVFHWSWRVWPLVEHSQLVIFNYSQQLFIYRYYSIFIYNFKPSLISPSQPLTMDKQRPVLGTPSTPHPPPPRHWGPDVWGHASEWCDLHRHRQQGAGTAQEIHPPFRFLRCLSWGFDSGEFRLWMV